MKKTTLFTAVAAAATLSAGAANADRPVKCKIVDADGNGLIKAGKADCGVKEGPKEHHHSCSGNNKAGSAHAWIYLPKETCDAVQAAGKSGDFSKLAKGLREKIEGAS